MTTQTEASNTEPVTFLGTYMRALAATSTPWTMDHVERIEHDLDEARKYGLAMMVMGLAQPLPDGDSK